MSNDEPKHWLSGFFRCAICDAKYLYSDKKRPIIQHDTKVSCFNATKSFPVEPIARRLDTAVQSWLLEEAQAGRLKANVLSGDLLMQGLNNARKDLDRYQATRDELEKDEPDFELLSALQDQKLPNFLVAKDYKSLVFQNDQRARLRWIIDHYDEETPGYYVTDAVVHHHHLELTMPNCSIEMKVEKTTSDKAFDEEMARVNAMWNDIDERIEEYLSIEEV